MPPFTFHGLGEDLTFDDSMKNDESVWTTKQKDGSTVFGCRKT